MPGCTKPVDEWHHIWHWIDGGPTDRANLLGLCLAHHGQAHAGELTISTTGDERFFFHRRGGEHIPEAPTPPVIIGRLEETQPDLDIDDTTIVPRWYGDKLELGEAVEALYRAKDQYARRLAS